MSSSSITKFKLFFTVPPSHLNACKTAVFDAGAGKYPGPGGYTQVAFTTAGKGQFKPGKGANPAIGSVGQLEHVEEVKVETLCVGEDVVRKAVGALKSVHPYEEIAYEVYRIEDF